MPLRRLRNTHGPSSPSSPSSSNNSNSFHATPPSAYITQPLPQTQEQPRERRGEMFDPFSNAPRPRRKAYSPFSAFEGQRQSQDPSQNDRPVSGGSAYSYSAESVEHNGVDNANGNGGGDYRNTNVQGQQAQARKQRRSTLSFEIGGPADETYADHEVFAAAPVVASSQQESHVHPHPQEFLSADRPSTGDESSPDVEPEDSHPSSSQDASSFDPKEEEEAADLVPPRPRFLSDGENRSSWSSQDSSLYPTSSAPNSDNELIAGGGTASDSDREPRYGGNEGGHGKAANGKTGGVKREREPTYTPPTPRQHTYKRRSGSYTSIHNVNNAGNFANGRSGGLPPGAAAPVHSQGQAPQQQNQSSARSAPYPASRRYSGSAHRRSSSNTVVPPVAAAAAPAEIEEIPRSESPANLSSSAGGINGNGNGNGVGVGQRMRGVAPPSAFRASRTSFSAPVGAAAALIVADDAHPLSPNPSYNGHAQSEDPFYSQNGGELSSVGHGSFVSASSNPTGAGMYAHQYPHGQMPAGYQYPPSPPSASTSALTSPVLPQAAAYAGVGGVSGYGGQGQAVTYSNVAPGRGAGVPNPVNGMNMNGGAGGGYAPPMPNVPQAHAFMANSAIARSSMSVNGSTTDLLPYAAKFNGTGGVGNGGGFYGGQSRRNSVDIGGFVPPQPPFAQGYPPPSPNTPGTPELRHAGSYPRLREPFLSPASRRSSSVWQPPTPAMYTAGNLGYEGGSGFFGGYAYNGVGTGSSTMLALPGKKEPLPSSALRRKISVSEKPWIKKREKGERASWWVTFCIMWIGLAIGAVVCFFGFLNVEKINGSLCSVLDDDFSSFNTDTWTRNVSLGGFGNGEFQMTTESDDNLYIKNGQLYIMPTLTSDEIGSDSIFDGYSYNLAGCTETWNASACSATSNKGTKAVVNPVKSARISTINSVSIAYGKVEIKAKMPRGDWLWPAIWMLPKDEKYGEWPKSGEIDIVESRGNLPTYAQQGDNYVRSSLRWGPLTSVIAQTFGWQSKKRSTYTADFHTYTLEWTSEFMRISVDDRLHAMLDLNIKKQSFFDRGAFPVTAQNGSTEAVVQNIWEGQPNAAPFDQEFYLIINLAVGGTSGWFPDNVGGKMWYDGSATAMTDFASEQSTWSATWPSSDDDRALRIDSVKMWKLC